MREILFRAKRRDSKQWVNGSLLFYPDVNRAFMSLGEFKGGSFIEVFKDTIGQYTGLTDKNGKKIFEGDILHFKAYQGGGFACPIGTDIYYRVLFGHCNPDMSDLSEYIGFWALDKNYDEDDLYEYGNSISYLVNSDGACVIGNIHDNPELLKGGVQE